ncbi:phytanoyl-CoA dioxygenase family protein [Pseudonocardia sp. H11422]|uniref:phytanoyl-CoA dioxygenase family protein n=1 Tax=Pseudonocardia sp. H11422 TaxID=2835866 RepID=UPI001BDCCB83|nr:phytanoyl-CoA dioxygenase family protein [Pseudonocardia sp. H11422]
MRPSPSAGPTTRVWLDPADADVDDLAAVLAAGTDPRDHPQAASVVDGVPVYDGDALRAAGASPPERRELGAELVRALLDGPGIVVLAGAFDDPAVVDRTSAVFHELIAYQHRSGAAAGDHFAPPGANDRVWNALEKLALRDPAVFADYYANEAIALVCQAWLGPGYQMTSQVNVVNPGGPAQSPHRDYHLGFQTTAGAARYPAHAHRLSPALTLQGAVAHCDMPMESGPTLYLPHSQKYPLGYLVAERPEFRAYFDAHHVQLPLAKGDAVFFNPALLHAAGHNRSAGIRRMANLLQVSSAFGRAMETVDRETCSLAVFPELRRLRAAGAPAGALGNVIAASAEGYAFPTDLDRDPPVDGLAPPSQADLVWQALQEDRTTDRLRTALAEQAARRRS